MFLPVRHLTQAKVGRIPGGKVDKEKATLDKMEAVETSGDKSGKE